MTSIPSLRALLRQRRQRLGYGRQILAGQALARTVCDLPIYQQSQNLALYLASDGEVDCRWLIKRAWRDGKHCYLPVVEGSDAMRFVRYRPGAQRVRNRYHIWEPLAGDQISPQALGLVIVPLVGFDSRGNRLGMGGGYYDRTFAFTLTNGLQLPFLLGVAHHCQQVGSLPVQSWDVPLKQVIGV